MGGMAGKSEPIVVCGAGIAGVAAAYHLAVVHGAGHVVLVEEGNPLSLTSDKSTEAYRNWWPGPDRAMTAFTNRSIDLLEALARSTGNRFNMNRRGYVFATAEAGKTDWMIQMARTAEGHGAGPLRIHGAGSESYTPSPAEGFDTPLTGADIITDRSLIRRHFPYLNEETAVVAHARRAGWLSAQQLGMTLLEAARDHGVRMVRGRLSELDSSGGRVRAAHVDVADGRQRIEAAAVVLAVGPMLGEVSKRFDLGLPVFAERHRKISFPDTLGAVPRSAPMMIWLDEQCLPWSAEEKELLAADPATRWLTEPFPGGVHGRPDGAGSATTLLALYNFHNEPTEVVFPLPDDDHLAEVALRGMVTLVPGLRPQVERGIRPTMDGGYYLKTRENRPLIGPTRIGGLYVSGAYSGFGIMASMAGGDLIARHVLGLPLPDYADAFRLTRYEDPGYLSLLERWGDGGQL